MKRLSLSVAVLLGVSQVSGVSVRDQKFNTHLAQLKCKQSGQCGEEVAPVELTSEDYDTITSAASDAGLTTKETNEFIALVEDNGLTAEDFSDLVAVAQASEDLTSEDLATIATIASTEGVTVNDAADIVLTASDIDGVEPEDILALFTENESVSVADAIDLAIIAGDDSNDYTLADLQTLVDTAVE